jgi:hypothetical protein
MRYALALVLTLVIGGSAMIQGASAGEKDTPQTTGSTVSAQDYGPSNPGTVAGPGSMTPSFQVPVIEHDPGGRN